MVYFLLYYMYVPAFQGTSHFLILQSKPNEKDVQWKWNRMNEYMEQICTAVLYWLCMKCS